MRQVALAIFLIVLCIAARFLGMSADIDAAPTQGSSSPMPVDARTPDAAPLACYANLCGMDTECFCHDAVGKDDRRCWSQDDDCGVDLKCCIGSARNCKVQGDDECTRQTVRARKARDRKIAN